MPWGWGNAKYIWLGYLIPVAYAVPVYLVVWLGGWGGFAGEDFLRQTAATLVTTVIAALIVWRQRAALPTRS